MRTDELIVRLASAARPVTPLRPPAIRLVYWMAWTIGTAGLGVFLIGPRADVASALASPTYGLSLVLLLVMTLGAAAAAFVLSVPGAERSWGQRGLPVAAAVAWPTVWILGRAPDAGLTAAPALFHAGCAAQILAFSALFGWWLLVMIRHGAPLRPSWTAATVSLAAIGGAAAATQVICPISHPMHQLVGHVLVAALVGMTGTFVGRWSIRW